MKRRTVISALGASVVPLTGCLGRVSSGPESTATGTPTPPHDSHREVDVTSVDTVPDTTPLVPTVEVIRPSVTADQTARIDVEMTNTADHSVWNTYVRIPAFSDFITQESSDGQKLLLLQPDERYATVRSGCWRADLSKEQINYAYTNVVTDVRYDPGETTTTQFDIYGHPENTGPCLPPGEYPIEASYEVSDDADTDTAEWKYSWGFSITVEET